MASEPKNAEERRFINTSEAFKIILRILEANADLKPLCGLKNVQPSSHLVKDLGYDSLAIAALFFELQEKFPTLTEEEANKWKTIEDCCQSVMHAK